MCPLRSPPPFINPSLPLPAPSLFLARYMSYAGAGKNSRGTQLIMALEVRTIVLVSDCGC